MAKTNKPTVNDITKTGPLDWRALQSLNSVDGQQSTGVNSK